MLVAVGILGLIMLLESAVSLASEEEHEVRLTSTRKARWSINGKIAFTVGKNGGYITPEEGNGIRLSEGDRVEIVFEKADTGRIWFGKSRASLSDLPVKGIYINDRLVASNTRINSSSISYIIESFKSTLRVELYSDGDNILLSVDGHKILSRSRPYKGYVILYNVKPTDGKSLRLSISTRSGGYFYGMAAGVEWNGNVIGVSEYPFSSQFMVFSVPCEER